MLRKLGVVTAPVVVGLTLVHITSGESAEDSRSQHGTMRLNSPNSVNLAHRAAFQEYALQQVRETITRQQPSER